MIGEGNGKEVWEGVEKGRIEEGKGRKNEEENR